ncbi:unnamed protein product [Caretta caretta]
MVGKAPLLQMVSPASGTDRNHQCPGGRSREHLDLREPERVLPPLLPCPRGTHRPLWLPAAIQVLRAKDLSCGMDQAQKCQIHINSPLARMLTQH